jgi:hypothetical protein
MPRNGDGSSDNVVDTSAGNQVHGVGEDSSIDRSGKVILEHLCLHQLVQQY